MKICIEDRNPGYAGYRSSRHIARFRGPAKPKRAGSYSPARRAREMLALFDEVLNRF